MRSKGSRIALAGALFAGLAVSVGHASGNAPTSDRQDNSQTIQSQQPQSQQGQKTRRFTGKITRTPREHNSAAHAYVLQDARRNATFYLDNETEAAMYDGLKVTITGTLDTSSNTIHVLSIKE